jgi:hypothetical protein
MTKRVCDWCNEEMEDSEDEPKFVITSGTRRLRIMVTSPEEEDWTDICKKCAKEAIQEIGFVEED